MDWCIGDKLVAAMVKCWALLLVFVCLSACSGRCANPLGKRVGLEQVSFDDLSMWSQDGHEQSLHAFVNSCQSATSFRPAAGIQRQLLPAQATWEDLCDRAQNLLKTKPSRRRSRDFWQQHFIPHRVIHEDSNSKPPSSQSGVVTGYYAIEMRGSRQKKPPYIYPIYAVPPRLKELKAQHRVPTRAEIDHGALKGLGLEIVYVDDQARRYFLHVQGSGFVMLDDGDLLHLGYHGDNGRKYRCINSAIKQLDPHFKSGSTMEVIRWLHENPQLAERAIAHDPSYVFFRVVAKNMDVVGAQGIPLIAGRSVAADDEVYSYGLPMWIETSLSPKHSVQRMRQKYNRLAVIQDRGGAIRGSRRIDLFLGRGAAAERLATSMKEEASLYLLLPKKH